MFQCAPARFGPVEISDRAAVHAALGDTARLAIVEELHASDRSPVELARRLDLPGNLLAHHLDVLERAGLVSRNRSSGDGRRRYVHLETAHLDAALRRPPAVAGPALFVCTANSARSQLAAVVYEEITHQPATSAGTHPADRIHPGAVAAARRAGVPLTGRSPADLADVPNLPHLVITVCDRAHEELDPPATWLHWSVPDPVPAGTASAFDGVVDEMRRRVATLVGATSP